MAESLGLGSESYSPDALIGGSFPVVTKSVTIDDGNLTRGSVLGKIAATGKYILSLSAAVDGSETPDAVLLQDVDATTEDRSAIVMMAGQVNEEQLTFGTGHDADSVRDPLRSRGIHLEAPVQAN